METKRKIAELEERIRELNVEYAHTDSVNSSPIVEKLQNAHTELEKLKKSVYVVCDATIVTSGDSPATLFLE